MRLAPGEAINAVLLYCSKRNRGHAGFSASGFLDSDAPDAERQVEPQLYFMILLEERRVWVVARTALRDIYRKLGRHGKVPRFSLGRTEGSLRLLLPKKKTGIDLDECVLEEAQ